MPSKQQLESLENEVKAVLKARAEAEHPNIYPVTDGVIDEAQFLSSSPKMLWILKEPWEKGGVGDWSLTKQLIPELIAKNKICGHKSYGPMAYVTFSVFNKFVSYSVMKETCDASKVGESLKNIAYINVSKFPGKSRSKPSQIAAYYERNKAILLKQISVVNPDVVIGGSTLTLFLGDLQLAANKFKPVGALKFCVANKRLYIDAYHPSRREYQMKTADYVDEIVSVIKSHSPVLPPPKS